MTELTRKTCTPCQGGIPPLTATEVAAFHQQTPDWAICDEARRIERTYRFKNFADAFAFMQQAAELAETAGYHPDLSFGWGYATVSLQPKKIEGCMRTTSSSRPSSTR